jgi:hypothetical protein
MKRVGKRSSESLRGTYEVKPSTGAVWVKRGVDTGRITEATASGSAFNVRPAVDPAEAATAPRGDHPVATPRKPGSWKGRFVVGPEFFEPMTEAELSDFEGR